MLNMFLISSFIFVLAESNAADGYILWHNCAPGVYLHGRKVICRYLLPSFMDNHFSVSVTFVSDASNSASGKFSFSFLSKRLQRRISACLPIGSLLTDLQPAPWSSSQPILAPSTTKEPTEIIFNINQHHLLLKI